MKKYLGICVLVGASLLACGGGGDSAGTSSGSSNAAPFSKMGWGDTVFDIPAAVTRVRIQGTFNGNSSNFMVRIDGYSVVNELLGTSWGLVAFDGTYLLKGGGTVEITNSSKVAWTFTEVR